MLQADSMGHYGVDIGSSLMGLLEKLLGIDPTLKIGMPNIHPAHFILFLDEFRSFIQSGRSLHLRVPIQSASSKILERMGRGYDKQTIVNIFEMMKSSGFSDYSTDAIVGFPGETENDFACTMEFIDRFMPTYVNLSMYFDAPNLASYHFTKKVPLSIKKERIQRAEAHFSKRGIYCNTDGGKNSKERQRRIGVLR
jgi:tRNA A37 methylthiotransferase MiaB